jgi:DNA-binding response OmpR family regulator
MGVVATRMSSSASFPNGPTILIIDDEEFLRQSFGKVLMQAGYRVLEAGDGVTGIELAERTKPALILLDVHMAGLNGWQTLQGLQERGLRQPVIMLTGDNAVESRVRGLGAGADDYLGKPCDLRELLARVHAALRRRQPEETPVKLQFGEIAVNLTERTATQSGRPFSLTRTEFEMLDYLAKHVGRPVERKKILEAVWGYTREAHTRTLETHIWRLRSKLGDDGGEPKWIRTVAGVGYTLERSAVPSALPRPARELEETG